MISYDTFEYRAQDEGARGAFDWQFYYKRLPLLPDDLLHPTRPFKSPVMAGGLFAISARFFWELGGYDDGLDIWGKQSFRSLSVFVFIDHVFCYCCLQVANSTNCHSKSGNAVVKCMMHLVHVLDTSIEVVEFLSQLAGRETSYTRYIFIICCLIKINDLIRFVCFS